MTLPPEFSTIPEATFYDCISLTDVTLPARLCTIDYQAFSGCTGLRSITIIDPQEQLCIKEDAFSGCSNLRELRITTFNGVIAEQMFRLCPSLQRLSFIPGKPGFQPMRWSRTCSCKLPSLKEFSIPAWVKTIANNLIDCPALSTFEVDPGNQWLCSTGAFLLSKDRTELIWAARTLSGAITLPETIVKIRRRAFYRCMSLEEVTIPAGVQHIAKEAFSGCRSLTKVTFLGTPKVVDIASFRNCPVENSLVLP